MSTMSTEAKKSTKKKIKTEIPEVELKKSTTTGTDAEVTPKVKTARKSKKDPVVTEPVVAITESVPVDVKVEAKPVVQTETKTPKKKEAKVSKTKESTSVADSLVLDVVAPTEAKTSKKKEAKTKVVKVVQVVDESDVKKSRVQLSTVLDINISQARCATHLKHNLSDDTLEAEIRTLRATLNDAKLTGRDYSDIKTQITEKSKKLVRISSETPIAVAVIWDGAVKELLRHGMDQAILNERKIVDTSHIHNGECKGLLYFPLYNRCANWVDYSKENEEALKLARATKVEVSPVEGASSEVPPVEGAVESDSEEQSQKPTFYTYVENALKTVKNEEPYQSMRVSNRVREYLSELVSQGIARHSNLARILAQRVAGVRTMNAGHVKAVANMLMADGGCPESQIELVTSQIDDKLDKYHAHIKSEKFKKEASLDDETKTDNARKQRENELTRKRKRTEQIKKHAFELAHKAKELGAETNALELLVVADRTKVVA